jgi:hypothetical protein
MNGPTVGTRAKCLPWGVIGALGLVVAVEGYLARHNKDFTLTEGLNWGYAIKAAATEARGCEILAMGSSASKFGVISRVIERETGKRTFNLATCSGDMATNYFVFRRAVEAGARPKAVLLDCYMSQKTATHRDVRFRGIRSWAEILDLRDALDLAWTSRDPDFLTTVLVSQLLPSCKARYEVRNRIMAALRAQPDMTPQVGRYVRRNWKANLGTQVMQRSAEFEAKHPGERLKSAPRPPTPEQVAKSDPLDAYSRRFLALAAAHGIRVFYLLPPVSPGLQESRIQSGQDTNDTIIARKLQALEPRLVLVEGRQTGYPTETYFDPVHLNEEGARRFSADVAAVLNRYLAGPTPTNLCVNLPPYREGGGRPDYRLETMAQSMWLLGDSTRR